ncbi:glycosyltransferase [Tunturiibacter psychrotolerans]|uniref:glycosyltransferase n=1 Tax=Tunturiibacter psychrotolerans TaxID=3069686 RepID=UPI003D190834
MKIGFIAYPASGHLYSMTALARKVQSRGHEVICIGVPDTESIVRAAGLTFVPYCEEEFPMGSLTQAYAAVAKMHGIEVVTYTSEKLFAPFTRAALKHLPQTLEETGVEALVIDTIHFFFELVPINMGIPYVQVCCALHLDLSGTTPPFIFNWPHETTSEALTRNIEGVHEAIQTLLPVLAEATHYADSTGLGSTWQEPGSTLSKLAVITQTPKEFDFPGIPWPAQFHYAGPLHDGEGREPVAFPWQELNGKPLIYASLGTLVNGLDHAYKAILEATEELPEVQLVLSVGHSINPDDLRPIPPDAIIVRTAPQLQLLKRAALCITHAGLNTTLEALAQGVPMVALPIGYDQPGVAARIEYHRVGKSLEVAALTGKQMLKAIREVLGNPSYRARARYFQKVIKRTCGLEVAADRIEEAFQNGTIATNRSKKFDFVG